MPHLRNLPDEIVTSILEFLSPSDLKLLSACNRRLSRVVDDERIWARICQSSGVSCSPEFLQAILNDVDEFTAIAFENREICRRCDLYYFHRYVVKPFGHLLGIWQGDYPLYNGSIVEISLSDKGKIIAERIEDAQRGIVNSVPLSSNPVISIDDMDPQFRRVKLFEILFCLEIIESFPVWTASIKCRGVIGARGGMKKAHTLNIIQDDLAESEADNEAGGTTPDPVTGLWPFIRPLGRDELVNDEEDAELNEGMFALVNQGIGDFPIPLTPMSILRERPKTAGVISFDCQESCHNHQLRTMSFSTAGTPTVVTESYMPLYSRVRTGPRLQSPFALTALDLIKSRVNVEEGVWVGSYGSHGLEFLLISFVVDINMVRLRASKITGDINVPRGVVTWQALVAENDGQDDAEWTFADRDFLQVGNNTVHLPSVDIPHSAQVFKGNGTVAMLGYRNASRIDAQILVINPQEIRVFWPSLRKISKFVKHK